jgi:RimJ/RimL family protein N-acetyltransferase
MQPEDAARLQDAINASLEHLRAWVRWAADEPESIEAKTARLRGFRNAFERGRMFPYIILTRDEQTVLGSIGMHRRVGAGAGNIGYWIAAGSTRRGFATEAAAALTRVGFDLMRYRFIEIHCDPANVASAGVARRLGFELRTVVRGRIERRVDPPRDLMIWFQRRDRFRGLRASQGPLAAFDALGQRLIPAP